MLESRLASGRNVLRSFSDIAILCRTHNQADLIENCLRHDSIPCIVMGRENYLETPEVCGTLAFSPISPQSQGFSFSASHLELPVRSD